MQNNISRRLWVASAAIGLLTANAAFAQERGTKEEAKAMNDAACEHIKKVGAEQAYKDFTTNKAAWTKKDLYVMVYDSKAIVLAHGGNDKLVGKDLSAIKDSNGNMIIPSLLGVARKGGGWYDYDWPDPVTKKMMAKSTYAQKLPSGDGFVGVGIYR